MTSTGKRVATVVGLVACVGLQGCVELSDGGSGGAVPAVDAGSRADAGPGDDADVERGRFDTRAGGPDDSGPADATWSDAGSPDSESSQDGGGDLCTSGLTRCDGTCVDLQQSDTHCGSCGNQCPDPASCSSGTCECSGGEQLCAGNCVDTSSNTTHCGGCNNPCAGGEVCSSGQCAPNQKVADAIAETNKVRSTQTDCGSAGTYSSTHALQGNAALHQAAQKHADDMVANDFFSHTGSDGTEFQDRIRNAGFGGTPVAENIAAGNSTAQDTVQQWKNSDGHCRNLMNSSATHVGIGVATGGSYGIYWVQVFGAK